MTAQDLELGDADATAALGRAVGRALRRGDAVCLWGPLGAGKTTLARGLIRALTRPDEEIPSPTFTLVQLYETPAFPVAHFDLYRLNRAAEAEELGLDEALDEGVASGGHGVLSTAGGWSMKIRPAPWGVCSRSYRRVEASPARGSRAASPRPAPARNSALRASLSEINPATLPCAAGL